MDSWAFIGPIVACVLSVPFFVGAGILPASCGGLQPRSPTYPFIQESNKKRRELVFAPFPGFSWPFQLYVIVEEEFMRMRTQADCIGFLALVADPHFNEVAGEDVAFEQEFVVFFQVVQ